MKRFIKVYLTLLIVTILATNLILVLLYGQRFLLNASSGQSLASELLSWPVLMVNGVILIIFGIFWAIARRYYRSHLDQYKQRYSREIGQ